MVDASPFANNGTAHGVALADGRAGRKALHLQGDGYIEVPKSQSLNPARRAWTVELTAKPEKPEGVLLARGGRTQGYALWLKASRPAFTVVANNEPVTVEAPQPVEDWAVLAGAITADRHVQLRVNGRLVATAPLRDFIGNDPNDAMQIGADLGSPVVEPAPPKFTGLIESVRIYSGEKE